MRQGDNGQTRTRNQSRTSHYTDRNRIIYRWHPHRLTAETINTGTRLGYSPTLRVRGKENERFPPADASHLVECGGRNDTTEHRRTCSIGVVGRAWIGSSDCTSTQPQAS